MPMSLDEIRAFLDRERPGLIGVVGTIRKDGAPHLTPVWYRWDGRAVHIWTDAGRIWVRQIARDPRVAFSVQEDRPPYVAVIMHGRATIVTEDHDAIAAEIRRITARYIPPADVDAYIQTWSDLGAIVTITPETIFWRRDAPDGRAEGGVIRLAETAGQAERGAAS